MSADTLMPKVADAADAKRVNSDPRAMREEEECLQISRCVY